MVAVRGVSKWFGAHQVLKDVSLDVAAGEVVAVIGPSGSGKTTLLRCVNLLEDFQQGEIRVDGEAVGYAGAGAARRRLPERVIARTRSQVGMVFQSFNLFPHMTVLKNVMVAPVRVKKMPEAEARASAVRLLERVGLADKLDAYPARLSGGQQQRVAIARALAMQPKVILLDEITSALDPELVGEVLAVIRQLARDGMTMMIVTHEMQFAREVAQKVVFMDGGAMIEQGPPRALFADPRTERLQAFLKRFREGYQL